MGSSSDFSPENDRNLPINQRSVHRAWCQQATAQHRANFLVSWDARPPRTLMQTLLPVASYWVPPSPPLVHLNLSSQYQVKKHNWWPLYADGVAAHAYSPVEGMVSWWVGDANCLSRRCHLIWRWLLLVVTRSLSDFWCSNDLRALRSVGCPAPPSGCLRDLFSLVFSLRTVTPPGS